MRGAWWRGALVGLWVGLAAAAGILHPRVVRADFDALVRSSKAYTLTNLHPDETRLKLYAVNYQQAGLIPVCTEVNLIELGRKVLEFEVVESGRVYQYVNHKAAAEPFKDHLARFFGSECPKTSSLSEADREGIRAGTAAPGMTRAGVRIAMGHPPKHVNPNPEKASEWMYWRSRFNRVAVAFGADGKVSHLRE